MQIREDLPKTAIAFSMLEIFKKLLATHEPVPNFFHYTTDLLSALNATQAKYKKIYLWHFLLMLSQTLGFGWAFDKCLNCKNPPAVFPVSIEYQNGGLICGKCQPHLSAGEISLTSPQLQLLKEFSQSAVNRLDQLNYALLPDITGMLLNHLTYHTETSLELKSLKWYV
jgi:DNA repair protein RecO